LKSTLPRGLVASPNCSVDEATQRKAAMTHSTKAFSSSTISPLGNYPFIPVAVTTGKKQACILPRHCVLPPQDSLENNKITYLQN